MWIALQVTLAFHIADHIYMSNTFIEYIIASALDDFGQCPTLKSTDTQQKQMREEPIEKGTS
jgi:hypothetical protein